MECHSDEAVKNKGPKLAIFLVNTQAWDMSLERGPACACSLVVIKMALRSTELKGVDFTLCY